MAEVDPAWEVLARCAGWEWHRFATGPLSGLLVHTVADPAELLRGGETVAVRASARLLLRDGAIFGVVGRAPGSRLIEALQCAGAALAGQPYDEAAFLALDAVVAAALRAAGFDGVHLSLEHNAALLPRPQAQPGQLAALALRAAPVAACPAPWLERLRQACGFDDPAPLAYVAALDTHVLAYRAGERQVHGIVLDRLAVVNFIGAQDGDAHARNRAQALRALPWLLPLLTAHGGENAWEGARYINQAIDAGRPLHAAVAQAFGVPRETVRWLGRRALPDGWRLDAGRLQRLLALLAWLAPERRPRDPAQFEGLTALGSTLAAPFSYRRVAGEGAALARIETPMRSWLAHVTRVGLDSVDFAQRALELADARDFLRALFEAVHADAGLDDDAADARVLRWCAGIGAARLLALSRAWHATVADAQEQDEKNAPSRWPPVLATPWQGEGRTVVELASAEQLRTEGRKMGHCVGNYEVACRSGNSVIVSLRGDSGLPLSTAELHLVDGVPGIVAGQHRAARNGAPGADCERALGALVRHLNHADGRLVARRRAFQRRQQAWRVAAAGAAADDGPTFGSAARQAARRLAGLDAR
ncbi:PcfJ domain-containing protein [Telluria beijingensis]|uniref:PcfJ domain-containing protein n=1 Tax=Telluria beijingensis TaxID=3068633 RepID=UPI002795639F|nr:PcfJ domain-containing protein [Massilia sp. REN29]